MTDATKPAIEVKHISLSFKGVKAISDLSFTVKKGEICALIGPNGAGKSSVLNILNGVYHADQGEIFYDEERFHRLDSLEVAKRGVGRGFQNNALFSGMSVTDNVLVGLSRLSHVTLIEHALTLGRARKEEIEFRKRAAEVLTLFDLERYAQSIVGGLPYGIQKKVEIARAIAARPKVLLLDEPLAGMNSAEKQEIAAVIAKLNRDLGLTIVIIEHDIGIVLNLAHHVVVLDYGRKLADGPPSTIRENADVISAYLGAGLGEVAA